MSQEANERLDEAMQTGESLILECRAHAGALAEVRPVAGLLVRAL